jgi:hypothetical protein
MLNLLKKIMYLVNVINQIHYFFNKFKKSILFIYLYTTRHGVIITILHI